MMKGSSLSLRSKLAALLAISSVFTFLCWLALYYGVLERFENQSWDWRQRIAAYRYDADPNIKIIEIDQQSLDYLANEMKQYWPIARAFYIPIVEFLKRSKAKGVAFDMLFTEYSATFPGADTEFAQMVAGEFPVISAAEFRLEGKGALTESDLKLFQDRADTIANGFQTDAEIFQLADRVPYKNGNLPFPELLESSPYIGNVYGRSDSDGVVRQYVAMGTFADRGILGLPLALFAAANPEKPLRPLLEEHMGPKNGLTLRFPGNEYERYPFYTVLSSMNQLDMNQKPILDLNTFKDAYVFIGPTAAGLKDLRPTPLDQKSSGVFVNAVTLDNLLHQQFIKRLSMRTNVFYAAVFILLAVAIILFVKTVRFQVYLVAALLSAFVLSGFLFYEYGYWVQIVAPFCCVVVSVVFGFAFLYQLEGRERAFIKDAFSHYLNPVVIDRIISDPRSLALGGERRELSIFFSDIAGFTTLSEQLDPRTLVQLLNKYLSALTDIVLANGGTLDKYEGDAIICFWNAPLTIDDHATAAVRTALECQAALNDLYPEFQEQFGVLPKTRIGINTGEASVGNFGSESRFNYTVIGEAANLAARLEGLNKVFGTPILISERTMEQCQNSIHARRVGLVKVAGLSKPVTVYEPMHVLQARGDETHESPFETAIMLFEGGDLRDAHRAFSALEGDAVAYAYVRRIESELAESAEQRSPVWDLSDKSFLALIGD